MLLYKTMNFRSNVIIQHVFTAFLVISTVHVCKLFYKADNQKIVLTESYEVADECPEQRSELARDVDLNLLHGTTKKTMEAISKAFRLSRSIKPMRNLASAYASAAEIMEIITKNKQPTNRKIRSPIATNSTEVETVYQKPILLVCPEIWRGPEVDFPEYIHTFVTVNCTKDNYLVPFEQSTSIWFDLVNATKEHVETLFYGMKKSNYSTLCLILTLKQTDVSSVKSAATGDVNLKCVKLVIVDAGDTYADIVSKVVAHSAEFLLIGRDVNFIDRFMMIDRLLRVATYNRIDIVGGSHREESGKWINGCFQTEIDDSTFKTVNGYELSAYECMFCDVITSPFLIRKQLLETILVNFSSPTQKSHSNKLTENGFFLNLFMHLKRQRRLVMSCPDVMFHTRSIKFDGDTMSESDWKPLAQIWDIHRVQAIQGKSFSLSCDQLKTECDTDGGRAQLCCREPADELFSFCASLLDDLKVGYMAVTDTLQKNYCIHLSEEESFEKLQNYRLANSRSNFSISCNFTPKPAHCKITSKFASINFLHFNMANKTMSDVAPSKKLINGRWIKALPNPGSQITC